MLRQAGDGPFIVVDARGGVVPLSGHGFSLRFDPAAPCAGMGMMSDCRRVGEGVYAGRNAVQWRYRHCRRQGPGGTDAGRMWLDVATGLVLAYDAETGGSGPPSWDVLEIDYSPQADAVFALQPDAAAQAGD